MSEIKTILIETNSTLDIAGKVTELESSNRNYPVGNTGRKKRAKNIHKALIGCDTT